MIMHLCNCENPQRVYNKYINEHLFVPCGTCPSCQNARAARYTQLLETERKQHVAAFFVTLTYDDLHLPIAYPLFDGRSPRETTFVGSRGDVYFDFNMLFERFSNKVYEADKRLFEDLSNYQGIPYASKRDLQLFLKRLNKQLHDKYTFHYKNFRYWAVSEFGSTTLRPHFHGIFFVDDSQAIEHFSECVISSWRLGRTDTQYVRSSACSYCSQYINQLSYLPCFYQIQPLRPFVLCSRRPFIGFDVQLSKSYKEMVHAPSPTVCVSKTKDSGLVDVPLSKGVEHRLFPKCPAYGKISDSLRVRLYKSCLRFGSESRKDYEINVAKFLLSTPAFKDREFHLLLSSYVDVNYIADGKVYYHDDSSSGFVCRLYYLSRLFMRNSLEFDINPILYLSKINLYYDKKSLYLLGEGYKLQSQLLSDEAALFYPEYLHQNGFTIPQYAKEFVVKEYIDMCSNSRYYYDLNHKSHFKNAYLDSVKFRNSNPIFHKILKTYYNAKKCNEVAEAFA